MRMYEYKCVCILGGSARTTRALNHYGRNGWELVNTWWVWYYFRRPLN